MKRDNHKGHLLSIDFESWFFSKKINKQNLTLEEYRRLDDKYIPHVLDYLLDTLRKHNQKTTFFIVGKIEEIYPGTIERILKQGHEIGWHTHTHEHVLSEEVLKKELYLSSKIIKKYKMKGFQAPAIKFFKKGYQILKDHGFEYSSSIYGNSNYSYKINGILEIPVSSSSKTYKPKKHELVFPSDMSLLNMKKFGIPFGSSYFWGILRQSYYNKKFKEAISNDKSVNLFIHDWQLIAPTSPRYKKNFNPFLNPSFLPYTINLSNMFEYLLANYKFRRFKDYLKDEKERK